ncbi:ankyrin repeat domain-containing protein [Comamonas antarctica]|uniref:Ankyrin repeat domain-containing protein n=1 Tax=Comamonas antarctica TaxID=2743470 RepID=A0A6N1X0D5_9BURK|nr:ankyrin repeat domain-containing protein [Comamonas antarctica]QKV52884.1 ankyrin repeat domain-containing protein [Comamonas antarctica]
MPISPNEKVAGNLPANAVNAPDARGFTRLMHAAGDGSLARVNALLILQAAVDATAPDGTSALMCAVASGVAQVVWARGRAQAPVNAATDRGLTALMLAASKSNGTIVSVLCALGADTEAHDTVLGWTALFHAVLFGQSSMVALLLALHADIDARALDGSTPLMLAVREKNLAVVQILGAIRPRCRCCCRLVQTSMPSIGKDSTP